MVAVRICAKVGKAYRKRATEASAARDSSGESGRAKGETPRVGAGDTAIGTSEAAAKTDTHQEG